MLASSPIRRLIPLNLIADQAAFGLLIDKVIQAVKRV